MNTVGIYIRWNGDKKVFATQEKPMIQYAHKMGYDSYIPYHDPEPINDSGSIFATSVAQEMLRDAKAELIKVALARVIFPIGDDLFRASNFEIDFLDLPPELAWVFVPLDSPQGIKTGHRI